jgi:ribonuclease-3
MPRTAKTREFAALEKALGHRFRKGDLLLHALTHSSHAHEAEAQSDSEDDQPDNERLEFLGDAVLALAVSEELLQRFPDFQEGQLSKLRAHLVSQNYLVNTAGELHLGKYLRLGRGEEKSGGRSKAALLVDALEAVIGAMYLDGGFQHARDFVCNKILRPELERLARHADVLPITDYKSALQEMAHATGRPQPAYVVVSEDGPQHQKTFTIEARLLQQGQRGRAEFTARASGGTKKAAEQNAARQALEYLRAASNDGGAALEGSQQGTEIREPLVQRRESKQHV